MPRPCARSIAGAATCAIRSSACNRARTISAGACRAGALRAEPPRILEARRPGAGRDPYLLRRPGRPGADVGGARSGRRCRAPRCEQVARESYEAGLAAVKPGVTFASVVQAMEKPIATAGCWSKTPLLHTLTFGSTGFTPVNREQLAGTREEAIEGQRHARHPPRRAGAAGGHGAGARAQCLPRHGAGQYRRRRAGDVARCGRAERLADARPARPLAPSLPCSRLCAATGEGA